MGNFAVARFTESGRGLALVLACAALALGLAFTETVLDLVAGDFALDPCEAVLLLLLACAPLLDLALPVDLEGFFCPLFFFSEEMDSLRYALATFSNLTVPVRTR